MKSAVIYYSYSGNTRKVAEVLAEYLRQKSAVDILELKAEDESKTFFGQCQRAFWHKAAVLGAVSFDLGAYDLICIGSPVWAFAPVPAINTYLKQSFGVAGKQVVLFSTHGSGAGKKRCLNYMQNSLEKKGAKGFKRFSIQQSKVGHKEFILSEIVKIAPLLSNG